MNFKKIIYLLFCGMAIFLMSCNQATPPVENALNDSLSAEEPAPAKTTVKIPSPIELYTFMLEAKTKYVKENLSNVNNVTKYLDNTKKALNLGVYASDLGYCTVFKQNKETFTYFSTTKKLADEMGLTHGFDENIVKRIDKNINSSDSLYQIGNDSYSTVLRYLEQQGQSNVLPLIVTGAWIESINLAIKAVGKYDAKNTVLNRIADQGLLLENLIEMYNSLGKQEKNSDIYKKLIDLQQSFDKLDNENGGMTNKQFDEISIKVKSIRAEIIA